MVDIDVIRRTEFPGPSAYAYFNHASDSPISVRTSRTITERVSLLEDPLIEVRAREIYLIDAQDRLGQILGSPANQIAFLTNISDATAVVANGYPWRHGDEVIVVAEEFAGFVYPWRNLADRGVNLVIVPKNGVATDLDRIEAAINVRTRIVAISHVEYQTGYRNDLEALGKICRDKDLLLVVDASQSLGAIELNADAWNIDVVVSIGYKWLMAPHGISILSISPRAMELVRPTAPGRYSVRDGWETSDYRLEWHPDARRYQGGALNWIGVAALAESLELLEEIGAHRVERLAIGVADYLVQQLQSLDICITSDLQSRYRSQIVSFTLGSKELDDVFVEKASRSKIVLGRRGHGIRFGAHFWNTCEEVDKLVSLIRDADGSRTA